MKLQAIIKKGWKITCDGEYFCLTYSPNVIGENGAMYLVNENVYERALDPNIDLKQLIDEFNIFSNFKKVYDIKQPIKVLLKENSDLIHYGLDYVVTKEGLFFFIEYQLARHGGGSRKFEITTEIFEYARNDKLSVKDILDKFNLHHKDVPENDVK